MVIQFVAIPRKGKFGKEYDADGISYHGTAVGVTNSPTRPLTLELVVVDTPGREVFECPVEGIAIVGGNQPPRPPLQSDDTPLDEALTPAEWMIPVNQIAKLPPGKQWKRMLGDQISAPLRSGAIALIDAVYLLKLAGYEKQPNQKWLKVREGGIMKRRQDLPAEAFVTLDRLRSKRNDDCLRIICIS